MGDLSILLHLLICSIIYLYHYGLMGTYFVLWVIIHYYFTLLLHLWPVGALSVGSCATLTKPHYCGLFFKSSYLLSGCLLSGAQDALGSSCTFPASVLKSGVSPRTSGSCYWRMVLETKIWVLGTLIATGVSLLLGPLR